MWRLCIEDDEANRTVVNLVRKEYTIGRAEENAVRLTERNVSRRHATLRRTGDKWILEDLESQTGSFVNERRVEEPTPVEHRDKVRIGDYEITLLDSEKEAEEAAADKQNETVPASVESDRAFERHDRLVVVEGPNPGTQYPLLDKKLLIGRGEECDLTLPDTSVSRVHASLLRDEHGRFHISDQKSSNGVRVNGMEITKIPLYAGDIVELGDVHLQFVPKGSRFDESALRPATSARSVPTKAQSGGKLWVGLGLLGVVGGVIWFGSQKNRAHEAELAAPTVSVEDSLLTQAQGLLEANDADGALTLLKSVPPGSVQRSSNRFQTLAAAWARLQLRKVDVAGTTMEQRALLMQIVGFEDVGETHLNVAREKLRALATATQDGGVETDATPPVDPNTLPAASSAVSPLPSVAKPPPVAARPTPRPAPVVAAKPAPAPVPNDAWPKPAVVPSPAPAPSPAPQPSSALSPSPQPAAPQLTNPIVTSSPAPSPAPAPVPSAAPSVAPTPAPAPAPAVSQSPAQAAPAPAPAPPVNSPPVLNWPGAAP